MTPDQKDKAEAHNLLARVNNCQTYNEAIALLTPFVADQRRVDWILNHAFFRGGGQGFTVFVPVDVEDVREGIDKARGEI